VGGETTASNEISGTPSGGNLSNTLLWNIVPNAFGYNVYRSTTTGTEVLLTGGKLPASQPNPLTATVTFIDDGSASAFTGTPTISVAYTSGGMPFINFRFNGNIAIAVGTLVTSSGFTPGTFNISSTPILAVLYNVFTMTTILKISGGPGTGNASIQGTVSTGAITPPLADTTQQTALYLMPGNTPIPVSYSDSNIVAYFPASLAQLGQVPQGGSGGGGTTGAGISGRGNSTPSGGVAGLVGALPQMKQFTNRVCIALGNGFSPQAFWDSSGTGVNPAPTGAVSSVSVTGDQVTVTIGGAVSITDPTSPRFIPNGSNVVLSGMSDSTYNGTFVAFGISGSTFKVRNPSASGGASTGTYTVATTPLISTYAPSYPVWAATTAVAVGDIYVPATQPGASDIYITCIQAGITGGSEPSWAVVKANTASPPQNFPTGNIKDGSAIWQESGYLTSPPPPGAGHIEVYAGALWVLNTSPTNTTNGLDGPTALRQSNENNIFAWNPVYQAFLDKDDGAEGMALGKFTITAQGIPPEGSLIAFKYRVPYQIIGVFGANNFAIQPVSSDMGCLAPRSVAFVPGYGLMRYTHLGLATFDGWRDTVISEQVRPYLFPVNDLDTKDITVADANYIPLAWAAQTANPPMYAFAMPIGNSGGQLTRIMLYDLVLKGWAAPVDLPFPIGCMAQVQPVTSNPLTIIGGFNDGALQRWQAGDTQWYTGGGGAQVAVSWNFRPTTVASQNASQRVYLRKVILRGSNTGGASTISAAIRQGNTNKLNLTQPISGGGDFDLFFDIGLTGLRFDVTYSSSADVEIIGMDWGLEPRAFGVPLSAV
jgi:hypothetical protein